jgi:hypothetical protein
MVPWGWALTLATSNCGATAIRGCDGNPIDPVTGPGLDLCPVLAKVHFTITEAEYILTCYDPDPHPTW